MDSSNVAHNRRSRRSKVFLKGTLELAQESLTVVLRNLSQDGALVSGGDFPTPGTRVLFHREGLSVPSRIAWVHGGCAGIEFDVPLFPKELLRHVPPKEEKPVPEIKKRPGFGPKTLTAGEMLLIERWMDDSPYALGN